MSVHDTPAADTLRIKIVIARNLVDPVPPEEITDDTPLDALGLDSMSSINLLLDLESTFGVAFPDEMLTPETLRTVETIRTAIDQLTLPLTGHP